MLKRLMLSAALMVLLLPLASSWAEIYRYQDDKGELHYVDDISLVPEKYRGQLKNAKPLPQVNIAPSVPVAPSVKSNARPQDASPKKVATSKKMEVFVTSWCPYCKKLEAWLDSKGIPYTKYDIEKDENANKVYRELGGRGVPVTKIGSDIVHGYNPDEILRLIQ